MTWNGKTINWISKVSIQMPQNYRYMHRDAWSGRPMIDHDASPFLSFCECSSTAWTSIECGRRKWNGWTPKRSTFIGIGYVGYGWRWLTSGYCYNAVISTECEKNQNHIQCKSHVPMKVFVCFLKCNINVATCVLVCVCDGCVPDVCGCLCISADETNLCFSLKSLLHRS